MFTEMIHSLRQGVLPDSGLLRKRFDIAMTKKLGVIRLPSAFWMSDPKINPRADHLLMAALLLASQECVELATSVLASELIARPGTEELDILLPRTLQQIQSDLSALSPDEEFSEVLRERISKTRTEAEHP